MKKHILIMSLSLLGVAFAACTKEEAEVVTSKEVLLTPSTLTIIKGKTRQFKAEVQPVTATDKDVKWSTTDTTIIKITEDGLMTAVNTGMAYVVATAKDKRSTGNCQVFVKPEDYFEISVTDTTGADFSEGIFAVPGQTVILKASSSDRKQHEYSFELEAGGGSIKLATDTLSLGLKKTSKKGFLYYAEDFLRVNTETIYWNRFKVIASLASQFVFGEQTFDFETAIKVEQNTETYFSLLCQGKTDLVTASANGYELKSSNPDQVVVSLVDGAYSIKAVGGIDTNADIYVKFKNGKDSLTVCTVSISDLPQGGAGSEGMQDQPIDIEK